MGRPLNKRFFASGTGTTVGCSYHDGSSVVESAIIEQKTNSKYRVAGGGATPLVFTDLSFLEANPDTITRNGGADLTLTFSAGDQVRVASANTASNDGVYTIAIVTTSVITLTTEGDLATDAADGTATLALVAAAGVIATLVEGTPAALGEMQVTVTPELLAGAAEFTATFSTNDLATPIDAQTEADYGGQFTGGIGGTNSAGADDGTFIALDDGTIITVDTVAGNAVTAFTVDSTGATGFATGAVRTQVVTGTTYGGTGFTLTPVIVTNEVQASAVTSVAILTGGSGYFTGGTFNISVASDATYVAGTEAVITYTVLNQVVNSIVVTSGGTGYTASVAADPIVAADIPNVGATAADESARIISARTVKTFEGNTYQWPAAGGTGSVQSPHGEATLQTSDL